MVSRKLASIIAAAAFVAGSFITSPELRAYAAATIGSEEIIDESIRSVDIKNGQVKAADIATDAVGAAELQGVTKLIFVKCIYTNDEELIHTESVVTAFCQVKGSALGDNVIASKNDGGGSCFEVIQATARSDQVNISFKNTCTSDLALGTVKLSILLYKT